MSKLYFRYGAMNSGKTTLLLQVAHNYEERGMKVVILKPGIDTKGNVVQEPTYNLDEYLLINFVGRWHLGLDINMNYYNQL